MTRRTIYDLDFEIHMMQETRPVKMQPEKQTPDRMLQRGVFMRGLGVRGAGLRCFSRGYSCGDWACVELGSGLAGVRLGGGA